MSTVYKRRSVFTNSGMHLNTESVDKKKNPLNQFQCFDTELNISLYILAYIIFDLLLNLSPPNLH